jgi:hypothetical protein
MVRVVERQEVRRTRTFGMAHDPVILWKCDGLQAT